MTVANDAHWVAEGENWLRAGGHHAKAAEDSFRKCPDDLGGDLGVRCAVGLAEAILGQNPGRDRVQEAYNLLVGVFFRAEVAASRALRNRLLERLRTAAQTGDLDLELADLIDGHEPVRVQPRSKQSLLKTFYFAEAINKCTLGERTEAARRSLEKRLRDGHTITAEQYTLQFAKGYSSSTPLQDLAGDSVVGGGYFLALGRYGCVIDPGHHFLENFYQLPRTLADIDCIIVTHFHDDHYANLPALLSLLSQRRKRNGRRVRVLLDEQTHAVFSPLMNPKHLKSAVSKDSGVLLANAAPLSLNGEVSLHALPTQHDVFNKHTGVGLHFHIPKRNKHLIITGDTGWTADLAQIPSIPGLERYARRSCEFRPTSRGARRHADHG